uniref:Tospovirus resistance protein C n=1 Tax=Solanum tuberosum TaxID=4113 RepID=M1A869_SOLTU
MTKIAQLIMEKVHSVFDGIPDEYKNNHNLERGVLTLLESVQGNTNLRYNYELNDSDLSEYMGCLDKNLMMMCLQWGSLSDPSWTNEEILVRNRFTKKLKIIRRKMGFLRYIYVSEIIGYIDHEKLEGLQARIQFMADNVGQFCLALWVAVGTDDILSKPDYLLCLIVLVELEMKNIFLGELKASKYAKSRTFKDKKLPKGFSHHLHSLLVYLRNKKIENFPNNVSSRNIDVTIEFLLVFLIDDGSNHVISGNWLNEVMEKVGAIAGDVLYVIQKLLPRSINKNDTSNINVCSIQILEKVEDLKAQVETYYKSLKFTSSQFPIVGGLSFLDSLLRKLHDMLEV